MLSRVAESLYWMSRYVERAENAARLLDDAFHFELDDGLSDAVGGPIDNILTILSCRTEFLEAAAHSHRPDKDGTALLAVTTRDAVLRYLTFDRAGAHSILAVIALARENARATQEALSAEAWSQVNRLYLYLSGSKAQQRFQASPFRFFDGVKRACVLFAGLVDSTLPHGEVFHFLRLGRYLERVDMASRILTANLHQPGAVEAMPAHAISWTALLRSCSAYEAYLREYQDRIDPANVVRYLVLGSDFPRAMRFCVAQCLESLRCIGGTTNEDDYATEAERLLGRLDGELRYLDPDELLGRGLHAFLASVQETCNRVGLEIQHAYFLG
jgi:uncharacterized alpha-E superfamily protein